MTTVLPNTVYTGQPVEKRYPTAWALADAHVTDLLAILKVMGSRGLRVDRERLAEFNQTLDAEMAKLQQEFDADPELLPLRGFHPKAGYKREPKDTTGMGRYDFGGEGIEHAIRWARRKPFLATSSKQVLSYIRSKGHRVAKTKDGDDTSGQKALLLAWRKYRDEHYRQFVEFRKLKKLRGTYGEWPLVRRGDDWYVTTRFTLRPDNGRLSCVAAWTPVETPYGPIPIEKLHVGDLVWTHRMRWRRVTAQGITGSEEMYAVKFRNGDILTCTANHRLLVLENEYQQGMDQHRRECSEDFTLIQGSSSSHGKTAHDLSRSIRTDSPSNVEALHATGRIQGAEGATQKPLQTGREESNVESNRCATSQLDRNNRRWIRVSDLYERRRAAVCSQDRNGRGTRPTSTSRVIGSPPYRWRPKEQQLGQSSTDDRCRSQANPFFTSEGYTFRYIEEIYPVGSLPVYDISVEEDESYLACGVFSHNSLAPNVQNIPRDGPLAEQFKSCLVASPGCKLVRGDWTSAEALVTGWLARDEAYMRLCRDGIHKFTLAQFLGLPVREDMTSEEINAITKGLKEKHHVLYRQLKTARFGSTYLAGPRKIFETNPEEFENQAEARKFQQFCKRPKITAWQQNVIAQAKAAKRLVNPFGYEKAFWDIPGGDGPSAVAFLPSSIIAFIAKECMLQLWKLETGKYLVWQIHDELVCDVPVERAEAVAAEMQRIMEQPWPELGGLSIGCEIKISDSMA